MITDELKAALEEIEHDYRYYKNMGFEILAAKFKRDIDIINKLIEENNKVHENI